MKKLIALGILLCCTSVANAASRTWAGGGADGNWSTTLNWDVVPVAGDDLVFPGASLPHGTSTNDLAAGTTFHSLTFQSGGGTFYNISGNGITLGAGGITDAATNTMTTLHIPIALAANVTVTVGTAHTLYAFGVISGAFSIDKQGVGDFEPDGANTYSGGTTLSAGRVSMNGATAVIGAITIHAVTELDQSSAATVGAVTSIGGQLGPGQGGGGNTNSGNLVFDSATILHSVLNATTVGSFSNINVTGTISLGNSTLLATGIWAAPVGTAIQILTNDGNDAVTGTFANLPEGSTVTVAMHATRISYVGGDGNDVTLTGVNATTTALTAAPTEAVLGDDITFTATVSGTAVPIGDVAFLDGATMLGTVTLVSGVASFSTSTLGPGTHTITARYLGAGNDGESSGTADVTVDFLPMDGSDEVLDAGFDDFSLDGFIHDDFATPNDLSTSADASLDMSMNSGCSCDLTGGGGDPGVLVCLLFGLGAVIRRRRR